MNVVRLGCECEHRVAYDFALSLASSAIPGPGISETPCECTIPDRYSRAVSGDLSSPMSLALAYDLRPKRTDIRNRRDKHDKRAERRDSTRDLAGFLNAVLTS